MTRAAYLWRELCGWARLGAFLLVVVGVPGGLVGLIVRPVVAPLVTDAARWLGVAP